ncbi:MAG: lysophospholipid acyltransferase family protein [Candidatus Neomarinimicrobiota bacterium]|jgi:1-acyl-sn-glycerol-3-phosphate acyltransferase|nr:lysophospholipid acyltransferase family protein [Candidatus Neomarinimicrobiota bacterium]MDD3966007.1 lysophospholipid acyltransferase family protein [Candidatus Neomarinimicrobiota bacterium]MDX9780201.1 lysophospholipid acyltransferase family protein [bacterium]
MFLNVLRNIYIYLHIYLGNIFIGGFLILCSLFVRRISFFNRLITAWAKWAALAMPGKLRIEGLENIKAGQSYIIIANHESTVDIFYLLGKIPLPMRMVAKKNLEKSFIIGPAMKRSGFIFVDNMSKGSSIGHLNQRFEFLKKEGISLMFFPEGSRFKNALLSPFRPGAFVMAIQHGWPVLPIAIKGARAMMTPGKKMFHPSNIELRVLPPIDIRNYRYEDRQLLSDTCFQLLEKELKEMYGDNDAVFREN